MPCFNTIRWILPSISVVLAFSLVACENDKVVQPLSQPPIYPASQPQSNIDYSQQERYLINQLASAQERCAEYTQKIYQDPNNAVLAGGQSFWCQLASETESQLLQLQLQGQSRQ